MSFKNPREIINDKEYKDNMNLVKAHKGLKQKFQVERFGELSLLQDATKLFAPITKGQDKLLEKTNDIGKNLSLTLPNINNINHKAISSPDINNINQPLTEEQIKEINVYVQNIPFSKYRTNNTFRLINYDQARNSKIFMIGSDDRNSHMFLYQDGILLNPTKNDFIVINSIGVAKLLFERNPTNDDITERDCIYYHNTLKKYKYDLKEVYKKKLVNEITGAPTKILVTHDNDSDIEDLSNLTSSSGTGIKKPKIKKSKVKKPNKVEEKFLYLPSDPKLLYQRLHVLLGSMQSGNNNTRNEAMSIMDNLLKNNHMDKESYEKILREYTKSKL